MRVAAGVVVPCDRLRTGSLRGRRDGVWLLGSEGEPGPVVAGAGIDGIDVIASNAISACVASSAGNAGRDGESATPG